MKLRIFFIAAALIASVSWAPPASAKKGFKNLKVLADNGKSLKKGMKNLTKGLGVKCTACHIKGKWAKDEVAAKKKSRAFFKAVVGNNNPDAKSAALADLLVVLKRDTVKDEARLWKGVSMLQKK